jgi:hypothetical protein
VKNFKQFVAAFVLVLVATSFTFAGDTPCGVFATRKAAPTTSQTSSLETFADTTYQFLGLAFLGF